MDNIEKIVEENFRIYADVLEKEGHELKADQLLIAIERELREISIPLESLVIKGVSQPVLSCDNCKHEKWGGDNEGSYCKIHKEMLENMFIGEYRLDELGCLQHESKEDL